MRAADSVTPWTLLVAELEPFYLHVRTLMIKMGISAIAPPARGKVVVP